MLSFLLMNARILISAHGLNLQPQKMGHLHAVFQSMGYHLVPVILKGHDPQGLTTLQHIKREDWLEDIRQATQGISGPVTLLGVSLGALLLMDYANTQKPKWFPQKQFWFAPALTPRPITQLRRLFSVFGRGFLIPSHSPLSYRVHASTPVAAYQSLDESLESLKQTRFRRSNVETWVWISKKDELLSFKGLQKLKKKEGLTQWKLLPIEAEGEDPRQHLIIDASCVGTPAWTEIVNEIKNSESAS